MYCLVMANTNNAETGDAAWLRASHALAEARNTAVSLYKTMRAIGTHGFAAWQWREMSSQLLDHARKLASLDAARELFGYVEDCNCRAKRVTSAADRLAARRAS